MKTLPSLLAVLFAAFMADRLAADARAQDFDPAFATEVGSVNDYFDALALQPDGRILAGGYFSLPGGVVRYAARFESNGRLDASFVSECPSYPHAIAVQRDGGIVTGYYCAAAGLPVVIHRSLASGATDPAFAALVGAGDDFCPHAYALGTDSNDRLLVGGNFMSVAGRQSPGLVRLKKDGTRDSMFNPPFSPPIYGATTALAAQADGSVLVAGRMCEQPSLCDTFLARLLSDGTLDPEFQPVKNGDIPLTEPIYALAVQPDGKILVGGRFTSFRGEPRDRLARLNHDGSLDFEFNPVTGETNAVYLLALQADGKIIFGGTMMVGRLNPDGSTDPSFQPIQVTDDPGYSVASLALQQDGKILIGGYFRSLNGQAASRLVRFTNVGAAIDELSLADSAIFWRREGTTPEVMRSSFEYSADGIHWTALGEGTRVPAGWRLPGVNVPAGSTIRARGPVVAGGVNDWFVQTEITVPGAAPKLSVARTGPGTLVVSWPSSSTGWSLQQNTGLTGGTWTTPPETISDDGSTKSITINTATGSRFFRLAQ